MMNAEAHPVQQHTARPSAGLLDVHSSTYARRLWIVGGMLCMVIGIVGIVVPLLPTTDFVLLAAYCFSRGSRRWESWLLGHPRFGPIVRDWRTNRAIPLKAKWGATVTMALSCVWAAWALPASTGWIPAAICLLVATYLWSRPTRKPAD